MTDGLRIFLDANILSSAAKSDGAIRGLVALALEEGHELWASELVLEEARRNLQLKAPEGLEWLQATLPRLHPAPVRQGAELEASLTLPEKDRPVLAAAILAKCNALVTGDLTHFGELYGNVIQGVTVHSPRSLASALRG